MLKSSGHILVCMVIFFLLVGCNMPTSILPATATTIRLPTPITLPTNTPIIDPTATTIKLEPTIEIEEKEEEKEEESQIREEIIVGSKEYTKQLILGQMLLLMLEETGYKVIDKTGLGGSTVVRHAIEQGEIDLYIELTGTALSVYHELSASALPPDLERTYVLAKDLDKSNDLIWLDHGYFNNTYTLMVSEKMIEAGITTIEELADDINKNDSPWTICVETEFYGREQDGLFGMLKRYDFEFKEEQIRILELNQLYEQLRNGNCDISEGFATDGRIRAWGFYNLEDTLNFFPFYSPAPVIRQDKLEQYPELEEILGRIGGHLDDKTISQLNARVDIGPDGEFMSGDEESIEMVARDFLSRSGLLFNRPQLVIGSQEGVQELLLGQMLILMLAEEGYDVVDQTGLGEPSTLRTALKSGTVDMYWEYTGVALSLFHEMPIKSLSRETDGAFIQASSLDERHYGMIWLEPAQFDYSFALLMNEEMNKDIIDSDVKIKTLDELAEYMNENDAPFTICVPSEFYGREMDGLFALEEHYEFSFKNENIVVTSLDESYIGLRDGECEVAVGYNTDGRLHSWGFYDLTDSQDFFLPNAVAPVMSKETLDRHPTLKPLLSKVSPYLDQITMSDLHAQITLGKDGEFDSGDEKSVEDVAEVFLCEHNLLTNCVEKE